MLAVSFAKKTTCINFPNFSLDSKVGHPHWLITGPGTVAQGWNEALICRGFAALFWGFSACFGNVLFCEVKVGLLGVDLKVLGGKLNNDYDEASAELHGASFLQR